MNCLVKIEEQKSSEFAEAVVPFSTALSLDSIIKLFQTFVSEKLAFNESVFLERQLALFSQEQFPLTNTTSIGSNIPLSIFIAYTNSDNKLSQKIDEILRTIKYQEQNIPIWGDCPRH